MWLHHKIVMRFADRQVATGAASLTFMCSNQSAAGPMDSLFQLLRQKQVTCGGGVCAGNCTASHCDGKALSKIIIK